MKARALLQRETGLDLSEAEFARAVSRRMAALGVAQADDYLQHLTPEEIKSLIELLVVPESWMFRDADAFGAATGFVRGLLAAQPGRTVRILSIPCASGEEPYSMAMALRDAGVPASACVIDAVDLSGQAIERARRGRYTRNAFRGRKLGFRERYFTREGNEYQIAAQLIDQVRFSQGNLLAFGSAADAGRYDLIFCRNLLIYFDEPTSAAAIARLDALLATDGILLTGYAEVPTFCRHGFATLPAPGAFALQRAAPAPAPHVAPAPGPARRVRAPVTPPAAPRRAAERKPPAPAPAPADPLAQARSQADQGDYRGAAAACQAALASDPNLAEAYFILGMVSECEQDRTAADAYWRRCVYLQPNHYEALCHLALLAGERGDAAQAAAFRQRAARVYQRREGGGAGKEAR
jgi:chemotaxis protein methyltransferase WspC